LTALNGKAMRKALRKLIDGARKPPAKDGEAIVPAPVSAIGEM